jgi:NAD(P)-dependent dehydrogenase (short-subunit alcohol dehydrogenase family)
MDRSSKTDGLWILRRLMMLDFHGKVAIVTGVGSVGPGWGIGRAIAVLLARRGATVCGLELKEAPALETKRLIEAEGGKCEITLGDVTNANDVENVIGGCVSRFGRVDVLVNCVGQSVPGGPVEIDENTWDAQIDLNLKGAFLTCKHVLPTMESQRAGAIVNIASVAGIRCVSPHVAYAAAKAGLIQFSRETAVMYARKGIRINCVVPGLIETPVMTRLAASYAGGDKEALIARSKQRVPIGKMGDAWDIAYAAVYLASDEAKYITATELIVDGGLTATTPH